MSETKSHMYACTRVCMSVHTYIYSYTEVIMHSSFDSDNIIFTSLFYQTLTALFFIWLEAVYMETN